MKAFHPVLPHRPSSELAQEDAGVDDTPFWPGKCSKWSSQVVVLSENFLGISGENRDTFSIRLLLALPRDQRAARYLPSSLALACCSQWVYF